MNHRALLFLLAPLKQATADVSEVPSSQPSGQPSTQPSTQPSGQPSTQPSSQPSGQPSTQPSTQPSGQPSGIPSLVPSSIPSTQPSRQPSSIPSLVPSSIPSTQPSRQPSSIPSLAPSSNPSTQPSLSFAPSSIPSTQPSLSSVPSSIPSTQPTGQPSSIPSLAPSSIPSTQPTGQPSSIPSTQPSSIPSLTPTSQPSGAPSSQPSCTPSSAPTEPAETNLFYPDWQTGGNGCKNDGAEPSYMAANPSYYMSSTLSKCCTTYFAWNLDSCMGNERGVCVRALFYPDWEGASGGCINDGNEPKYMTDNALNYLFADLVSCCEQHYLWGMVDCTRATALQNAGLYYPDFGGSENVCKSGGGQPQYMNDSPTIWMHATLKECCSTNYGYNYNTCIGSASAATPAASPAATPAASPAATPAASPTATGAGPYYPDWLDSTSTCKNDGNEPNYMTNNPTLWMHATLEACCSKNFSWNQQACITGGGGVASLTGTNIFYKRARDWVCVQDCVGASPCGGLRNTWETSSYATRKECCASMWYDTDCMTRTIS